MPIQKATTTQPTRLLALPVVLFLATFYLLPSVLVALMAGGNPPSFAPRFGSLSLANFAQLFGSPYYVKVLVRTVMLGAVVGICAAVLGYPVAYFIARSSSRFRSVLYALTLIPMAVGMNMITLGWLVVLGRHGLINSALILSGLFSEPLSMMYTWGAMVVGLVNVLLTFMVLPIVAVLNTIDPSMEKAARTLGAGPLRTFALITFPQSLEGVLAGFLAVFMLSSGALVLPMLLGGQGDTILPVLIWEQYSVANNANFAAALALVLLLFSFIVLLLQMQLTHMQRVFS